MSVVMKEIEKRQIIIAEHEMKIEKVAKLREEAEQLEREIAETDVTELKAEVEELTEDAIKLGYIEVPISETAEEVNDFEAVGVDETAELSTASVTSV